MQRTNDFQFALCIILPMHDSDNNAIFFFSTKNENDHAMPIIDLGITRNTPWDSL